MARAQRSNDDTNGPGRQKLSTRYAATVASFKLHAAEDSNNSLKSMEGPLARNLIKFPGQRVLRKASIVDGLILEVLSPLIGFDPGARTLHRAGIVWVDQLLLTTEEELLALPGIGRKRVQKIQAFLWQHQLKLGRDVNVVPLRKGTG